MGGAAPHAMHCSARGWLEFTALNYVRLCFFRGCCQAARGEKKRLPFYIAFSFPLSQLLLNFFPSTISGGARVTNLLSLF
jgi:hypothetical protein